MIKSIINKLLKIVVFGVFKGEEQVDHSCVQEAIRKSLMSSVTNLSIRGSHGQSVDSVEDVFRRLNASGSIVQVLERVRFIKLDS